MKELFLLAEISSFSLVRQCADQKCQHVECLVQPITYGKTSASINHLWKNSASLPKNSGSCNRVRMRTLRAPLTAKNKILSTQKDRSTRFFFPTRRPRGRDDREDETAYPRGRREAGWRRAQAKIPALVHERSLFLRLRASSDSVPFCNYPFIQDDYSYQWTQPRH